MPIFAFCEKPCIPFLSNILGPNSKWSTVVAPNSMVRHILGPSLISKRKIAVITHTMNMSKSTINAEAEQGSTSACYWSLQTRQVKDGISIP